MTTHRRIATIMLVTLSAADAAEPPSATITNDAITASVYLPNAENGYYRATRFDWAGVLYQLRYGGHEFLGEWQVSDDPLLHDRITGPVDSYEAAHGFDEAAPGGTFVRVGVGVCRRPDEAEYRPFQTYPIVDGGHWSTRQGANWIEFVHEVEDTASGYGYRYEKRLSLPPGRPELVIDYRLQNKGRLPLETEVYNHNFFVVDAQPTGPDFVVRFPYEPRADRDFGAVQLNGRELTFARQLEEGESVFAYLEGYGASVDDHRFEIENLEVKAGVRLAADRPLSRIRFWAPRTTLCPEPFIALAIAPGQADRWSLRYEFYELE
jgi:hypothetical protein